MDISSANFTFRGVQLQNNFLQFIKEKHLHLGKPALHQAPTV